MNTDGYMGRALQYEVPPDSQPAIFFDPAVLKHTVEVFYRQLSAIISKTSLMGPAVENSFGSVTVRANRLIIHHSVAYSMVGLLVACILLATIAVLIVPTDGFLPHSPSTLYGLISLFLHSRELLARLRYAGASDGDQLARWLGASTFDSELAYDIYFGQARFCVNIDTQDDRQSQNCDRSPQFNSKTCYPILLHAVSRSMLCLGVIGLMIALELLLHKSNLQDGLGDINKNNNTNIHYTWTAIPAIIFGALSITYSAVDFQIRTLAPCIALKGRVSKEVFTQLELLDIIIPMAIYKEFRLNTP
ncbi:hypothetical protein F4824DRAFT_179048 [Ustulina deusta]|nr:hypothetical protein F4824DRAFT_179048 [Ustulina deusta]